jgi:hypothetical protein
LAQVAVQAPPLQKGVVPEQTVPHAPQLFLSVCVFTQAAPQSVPVVQLTVEQTPLRHSCPAAQACAHVPQFCASFWVSAQ